MSECYAQEQVHDSHVLDILLAVEGILGHDESIVYIGQ